MHSSLITLKQHTIALPKQEGDIIQVMSQAKKSFTPLSHFIYSLLNVGIYM